jgi:hypothetical protein
MIHSFDPETCGDSSDIKSIWRELENTSQQSADGAKRPRKDFADDVNGAAKHAARIVASFGRRCFGFRLHDLVGWVFPSLRADCLGLG